MYCEYLIYLCSLMQFLKKNIFGILAIVSGAYLLLNTLTNISDIQFFNELENVGEYIKVEKKTEVDGQPSLMTGGLKVSIIFLTFLLIPAVLTILHKRRKANAIVCYMALALILINFLIFPYYLTQLFSTFNTIS